MPFRSIRVMIELVTAMRQKKNAKPPSRQEDKTADWRTDSRSDDELFARSLGDDDDHGTWDAVCVLHFRGTQAIHEKAAAWCADRNPAKRKRGVDILAQLGIPKRRLRRKSADLWLGMLRRETNSGVLSALGVAFSHNPNPKAIPALLMLRKHKSAAVREGVVFGLITLIDPRAIAAEIELSRDRNKSIRDWATFALGSQIDTNTRDIRDALAARLNDSDCDTSAEAAVGLARRKDSRAIPFIVKNLTSTNLSSLYLEAAEESGDPRFLPILRKLLNDPDQGSWEKVERRAIRKAIAKCKIKAKR